MLTDLSGELHFQLVTPIPTLTKLRGGGFRIGGKTNNRWQVMREYNGLLICRERRQIDCIPPKWTKYETYDANIKIEIDFDPELDEYFGITTAKQQIVIDDEMWEKLEHSGKNGGALIDLVNDLRRRRDDLETELKASAENRAGKDGPRPSAVAMEESEKFKGTVPEPTTLQQEEAKKTSRTSPPNARTSLGSRRRR
jgi:hypothetical protein